jgi:hypothetical protein
MLLAAHLVHHALFIGRIPAMVAIALCELANIFWKSRYHWQTLWLPPSLFFSENPILKHALSFFWFIRP